MNETFQAKSLAELKTVGEGILQAIGETKVLAFVGPMGVGKTSLIKVLCEKLGVEDETSSPTYSIVNEYAINKDQRVYHFDCYRMEDEAEAYAIGMEEYLDSGEYCFIEWPEIIANLLPPDYVIVRLSEHQGLRTITVNHAE